MSERIYIVAIVCASALFLSLLMFHIMLRIERKRFYRINKFRFSKIYAKVSPILSIIQEHAIESVFISSEGIIINFLLSEDASQVMFNFKANRLKVSGKSLRNLVEVLEEDIPIISDFSKYKYSRYKKQACNGMIKYEYQYRIRPSYRQSLEYYANHDLCFQSAVHEFN